MSSAYRHIVLILCFLLGSMAVALADEVDSTFRSHNITSEVFFFEDPQDSLTLKEAIDGFTKNKFTRFNSTFVNFGNSNSYYWLEVDLKPDSIGEQYLVIPYPALELLDIWIPTGSLVDSLKYKVVETGFCRPFDNRSFSHYFYAVKITQPGRYYLRFHSVMGSVFPIMLYDRAKMDTTDSWLNVYNGFYVGIVFFILLSALAYFTLFRESVYFFYALYIANILL